MMSAKIKKPLNFSGFLSISSGWRDSNPRPLAPHASTLPGCATPRNCEAKIENNSLRSKPKSYIPEALMRRIYEATDYKVIKNKNIIIPISLNRVLCLAQFRIIYPSQTWIPSSFLPTLGYRPADENARYQFIAPNNLPQSDNRHRLQKMI